MRINRQPRESAAIVILRRKGYSINKLSGLLGRSTSFIHRILKANDLTGYNFVGSGFLIKKSWHKLDKRLSGPGAFKDLFEIRKSGDRQSILSTHFNVGLWRKWEAFILGETDRPP